MKNEMIQMAFFYVDELDFSMFVFPACASGKIGMRSGTRLDTGRGGVPR